MVDALIYIAAQVIGMLLWCLAVNIGWFKPIKEIDEFYANVNKTKNDENGQK